MSAGPKVFISYSHHDRPLATQIAENLREQGVEAWFDRWEILPGDSLVQRIFSEGLSSAEAFVVLLSEHSVQSRWVQIELDTALIQRIEGVTRVIPVRVSDVEVPTALRALRWIDLTGDVDVGMRELLAAIYQVHERPAIGRPPAFISNARSVVPGLSRLGSILAAVLLTTGKHESGSEEELSAQQLAARTGLTPEETDDAIDELEALGYVRTRNYFGTWPFTHGDVEPTYALFLNSHQDVLGYGPMEDVKAVASAVAAKKQLDGSEIMRLTGLSPLRINRAVDYLEDYGLVTVLREMGTSPFSFGVVSASGRTRRFVSEQAK